MADESEETYYVYPTEMGRLTIAAKNGAVTRIAFGEQNFDAKRQPCAATTTCATQIMEYLAGKRTDFSVPLDPAGTEFQLMVWNALRDIPYGQTRTYSDIAQAIGRPGAARAVGMANNKNPLPIVIPCHRVIGANGSLVGYAGGVHVKEFLLKLEADHS